MSETREFFPTVDGRGKYHVPAVPQGDTPLCGVPVLLDRAAGPLVAGPREGLPHPICCRLCDRKARLAAAQDTAGLRSAHFAAETGRLILVVTAEGQGLDPGPNGETAYYTICDDHGQCVGHESLRLARDHAANPLGWCEVCNGNEPEDDDL